MKFGLIGYPLEHSFSKRYFTEKFASLGLEDFSYELIPIRDIDEVTSILNHDYLGLNVTIPYKSEILPYLHEVDLKVAEVGAVNTLVRTEPHSWKGYNTDTDGFHQSLVNWVGNERWPEKALILGSGGSSKAVSYVLTQIGIESLIVSRTSKGDLTYQELTPEIMREHTLVINTSPVGMNPDLFSCPDIPYEGISDQHWIYDLIYNPGNTLFLRRCAQMGARTKNGLEMLHIQAEEAWKIWKSYGKF